MKSARSRDEKPENRKESEMLVSDRNESEMLVNAGKSVLVNKERSKQVSK